MPHLTRVATVCQSGRFFASPAENRDYVLSLLRQTLSVRPDIVCLPETFTTVSVPDGPALHAEPVPGPTTDAAAKIARENSCYVVCPIVTKRAGTMYNSAVIIDRVGAVAGIYDKRQPVTTSADYTVLEHGTTPGSAPNPVFELDFGRVGVQICFDAGFPESWNEIADAQARLVFWPSAYNGGFPLRVYAWQHHVFVVSSVRRDRSAIIDPLARTRAVTDERVPWIYQDINLDFAVCHWDFNYSIPERISATYGDRVEVRSDLDSARFLVEPRDPSITIAQLQAEFGFETVQTYHQRHREAYAAIAAGMPPAPQKALHSDRPQYAREDR